MLLGTKCKNKQKMEKKFFPSFCRFLLFYGTRKNISKVLRSPKPPDTLARKLHLTRVTIRFGRCIKLAATTDILAYQQDGRLKLQ